MADNTTLTRRWQGRPALAWATRIAIFVVPFIVAMTVAFLLSSQLPVAATLPVQIVRWLAIVAVSTVAMMGVDRLARRLLPLVVLLKLTLVFPDHAPSRFGVAMRTGTTAQLRKRLDAAREVPFGETQQEAAERLLELVGLLSHHDRLTRGHSERVRAYSHLIGEELGLNGPELDKLRWAALLHDVGKTAIDTAILNKPERLTDDEYDTIKTHPDEGRALVAPLAGWLGDSIQAVWQHHERFDGRGYPQGLSGTEISFAARVVSVADSYDVMTSARSYKQPMSADAARAELATCSGTQFDPIMVRAFLNVSLGRLRLMSGPLAWFAQLALFEPSGVVHATSASTKFSGSGTAGGSAGAATGTGSAVSSTGAAAASATSTAASTATAAAASTGSASIASTVAATAASVVASTVGIVAASPVLPTSIASAAAPITVAAQGELDDLPAPQDTVLVIDSGAFSASGLDQDPRPAESASAARAGQSLTAAANDDARPGATASTATPSSQVTTPTTPTTGAAPAATTSTTIASPPVTAATTSTPTTSTTTTTAPAATTTTTVPPTTSTTTVPATTTTTTTTTTTLPALAAPTLYLGGGVTNAIPAPAFHDISSDAPPDVALPNVDNDRDAAPGALVQKGAAGISGTDPTKVLKFKGAMVAPYVINDDLHIELYVAAKDFGKKDIHVEVGLYRCNLLNQCTLLGSDTNEVKNAKQWKKTKFHLHGIDSTIGIGEWVEVRAAVLDDSEDDGWFAFGTQQFDSKITVADDDD